MNYFKWIIKDKAAPTIQLDKFSKNSILCLANDINNLLTTDHISDFDIALPKVVVVGTQSSGKSSVINNIISMDIVPTGDTMVTRAPLEIQLNTIEDQQAWVEFWNFSDNDLIDKFSISFPNPTIGDIETIKPK